MSLKKQVRIKNIALVVLIIFKFPPSIQSCFTTDEYELIVIYQVNMYTQTLFGKTQDVTKLQI